MSDRPSFKCGQCGLVQFHEGSSRCRRCGASMDPGAVQTRQSQRPGSTPPRPSSSLPPRPRPTPVASYRPPAHIGRLGSPGVAAGSAEDPDIVALARHYRRALLFFAFSVVAGVGTNVLSTGAARGGSPDAAIGLLLMGLLVTLPLSLLYLYHLVRASNCMWGNGPAALAFLGTLVPCVGLLVLLVISNAANKRLRTAGIPIGLFGPPARYG